jgi:hypothetical protein
MGHITGNDSIGQAVETGRRRSCVIPSPEGARPLTRPGNPDDAAGVSRRSGSKGSVFALPAMGNVTRNDKSGGFPAMCHSKARKGEASDEARNS